MPVSRDQLDADIATEDTNLQTYIGLVNQLIHAIQQPDFSAEDASVQTMITNIQNAQANLPPPPPGPSKPA